MSECPKHDGCSHFDEKEESLREFGEHNVFFETCGHWGPEKFLLVFWDLREEELQDRLLKKKWFSRKKVYPAPCPKCVLELFKKCAIRCAVCGGAITPGETVVLYHKTDPINHEATTFVGNRAIGCTRGDCCIRGAFLAGEWTKNGFRPIFPDNMMTAEEAAMAIRAAVGDEEKK